VILTLKRTPGIYLVGFMGCGKSTVGRLLADELGWRFVDLDHEIERAEGESVPSLFETRGEEAFRGIEHRALRRVVREIESGQPYVVALGGGAFAQPRNQELLVGNGVAIWLDCPLEIVESRVARSQHRPLARDLDGMRRLYRARREWYSKAEYRIEVDDREPTTHVAAILRLPLF